MENLIKEFNLFAIELQLPLSVSEKVKSFLSDISNAFFEHSHKVCNFISLK